MLNIQVEFPKSALQILNEMPENFTLTGSRRFSKFLKGTEDYDFFAQWSRELEFKLINAGFVKAFKYTQNYLDKECICVYEKENVDVQLRKNAAYFERVCLYIDNHPIIYSLVMSNADKSKRYEIWNQLFDEVI